MDDQYIRGPIQIGLMGSSHSLRDQDCLNLLYSLEKVVNPWLRKLEGSLFSIENECSQCKILYMKKDWVFALSIIRLLFKKSDKHILSVFIVNGLSKCVLNFVIPLTTVKNSFSSEW